MSERSPDDHLRDDGVRGIRQAEAHAEIHVQTEQLEVDDSEKGMLLLVRGWDGADRAVVRIVFDADPGIAADVAGQPGGRCECRSPVGREAQVDDRIDDEFPTQIAHANDRADFQADCALREAGRLIAQLEIDPVEELTLFRMRRYEKLSELEAAWQESAAVVEGERQVEAQLVPVGHAVGQLRCAVERPVGGEATGKVRSRAAAPDVVQMLLKSERSRRGNVGVVDLDFVDRVGGDGRVMKGNRSSTEALEGHRDKQPKLAPASVHVIPEIQKELNAWTELRRAMKFWQRDRITHRPGYVALLILSRSPGRRG